MLEAIPKQAVPKQSVAVPLDEPADTSTALVSQPRPSSELVSQVPSLAWPLRLSPLLCQLGGAVSCRVSQVINAE